MPAYVLFRTYQETAQTSQVVQFWIKVRKPLTILAASQDMTLGYVTDQENKATVQQIRHSRQVHYVLHCASCKLVYGTH